MNRISLSMIVRDEAAQLRDCLESVADFVDEMVVLDTGSADDSVAIAEDCGAVVHHLAWPGDFAPARNRALELVSGDWVLVLDADERLLPQVRRQLIDERLRLQELQRRAIAISDQDIAAAIGEIEAGNGLPRGMLRQRLAAAGVDLRTMIDQIRVQIGWSRLLRGLIGRNSEVNPTEITEMEATLRAQVGQTEWRVAEIFVPIGEARQAADAQRFADTIIAQLRSGANFGVATSFTAAASVAALRCARAPASSPA
jgi:glycosyltransferase involved in cell wall biosynthesis